MSMETINQTVLNAVLPNQPAKTAQAAQKEQFAKDFESVFIEKLLDEMKNTIGSWGFERDAAAQQVQGLFWMYLARDVAQNGGLGMSEEIYQWLNQSENQTKPEETLDKKL